MSQETSPSSPSEPPVCQHMSPTCKTSCLVRTPLPLLRLDHAVLGIDLQDCLYTSNWMGVHLSACLCCTDAHASLLVSIFFRMHTCRFPRFKSSATEATPISASFYTILALEQHLVAGSNCKRAVGCTGGGLRLHVSLHHWRHAPFLTANISGKAQKGRTSRK